MPSKSPAILAQKNHRRQPKQLIIRVNAEAGGRVRGGNPRALDDNRPHARDFLPSPGTLSVSSRTLSVSARTSSEVYAPSA